MTAGASRLLSVARRSTAAACLWIATAGVVVAQVDAELAPLQAAVAAAEAGGDAGALASALDALAARQLQRRRYDEAASAAKRAYVAATEAKTVSDAARADYATRAATAFFWAGKSADGAAAAEDAVEFARRAFGDDDPRAAPAWIALASNLQRRRDAVAAMLTARRGLRCAELSPEARLRLLTIACEAALAAGRPAEAREILEETERETADGEAPSLTAQRENLSGQIEFSLGRYAEAAACFRRVAALQDANPRTTAAERAATSTMLGRIALGDGRFDEAAERFGAVREVFAATPHDPRFVRAALDLAQTAVGRGDAESAQRFASEAEKYGRDDPDPQVRTRIVILVAAGLQAAGRNEEALAKLEPLLAEHAASPAGREAVHMQALAGAARAAAALGRGAESLAAYRRASEAARALVARRNARLSEAERIAASASPRAALHGLLSAAAEFPPSEADVVAVAEELLGWKGAVLRSVRAERAVLRAEAAPAAREATERLVALERKIAGRLTAGSGNSSRGAKRADTEQVDSIRTLLAEREKLERERAAHAVASPEGAAVRVADLTATLAADEVLLDFFVFERYRPGAPRTGAPGVPHVGVAAYRGGVPAPRLVFLGSVADVRAATEAHLRFASRTRGDEPGMAIPAAAAAAAARRACWEPFSAFARGARRVFIAHDGFTAALPFETLPADDPARLLVEEHEFVALPTAADVLVRRPTSTARGVLLVGDVDFGDDPTAEERPASRGAGGRRFRALPQSRAEIEAIARRWLDAGTPVAEVRVLTGREARAEAVVASLRGRRIVHFATHAIFGADAQDEAEDAPIPEDSRGGGRTTTARQGASAAARSGVVLAAPGGAAIWSAGEAALANFDDCELVIVSACDSGLGASRLGEGMLGLRRAFALAGARATVTALWPVRDDAASAFMQALHGRLTRGESPAAAVRGAKLDRLAATRSAAAPHGAVADFGAFVFETSAP